MPFSLKNTWFIGGRVGLAHRSIFGQWPHVRKHSHSAKARWPGLFRESIPAPVYRPSFRDCSNDSPVHSFLARRWPLLRSTAGKLHIWPIQINLLLGGWVTLDDTEWRAFIFPISPQQLLKSSKIKTWLVIIWCSLLCYILPCCRCYNLGSICKTKYFFNVQ